MRERAIFRPSFEHATPRGVADFMSEVFAALDRRPRQVDVTIDFSESFSEGWIVLDLERGEPVFRREGDDAAHGRLSGRWLAEHDVPLTLSRGATTFRLLPTCGNRIKVRHIPNGWRRLLPH